METKRCALMRQTWYDAARKRMKDGARLAFYEACFEYEFYNREPEEATFVHEDALLMFDMVKDALAADAVKAENIAMRNRRNGSLGGRPRNVTKDHENDAENEKPKETQENPENPSGYFGNTTTLHYTTLQDKNKSLSLGSPRKRLHKDIEKYEKFCVMFVFFYSGAQNVQAECDKFYNYYAARDWQVGKGQRIKDKVALAKTWEIKDSIPGLITARSMYAGLINTIDPDEPELLTDFVAMIKKDEQKKIIIRMCNGNTLMQILEKKYLKGLSVYLFNELKLEGYTLEYDIT